MLIYLVSLVAATAVSVIKQLQVCRCADNVYCLIRFGIVALHWSWLRKVWRLPWST